MALTARDRITAVNFLHDDIEYVTISYYAAGSRNAIGEPARTLTQRDTNVKCSINPMIGRPAYPNQAGEYPTTPPGILDESTHTIFVHEASTIVKGDVVTDYDGNLYDVLHVTDCYTHKEGYMRINT